MISRRREMLYYKDIKVSLERDECGRYYGFQFLDKQVTFDIPQTRERAIEGLIAHLERNMALIKQRTGEEWEI